MVLGVVEIAQAVEAVVDLEADLAGVESGLVVVRALIAVVAAIEVKSLWVGLMEVVHYEIVVALTVEAAAARLVAVPVSMLAANYRRTDRIQCPKMAVAAGSCLWRREVEEILQLRLMLSASLVWIDDAVGLAPLR